MSRNPAERRARPSFGVEQIVEKTWLERKTPEFERKLGEVERTRRKVERIRHEIERNAPKSAET